MAYYSDDLIEDVVSQNDIVDIVSEYLPLKRNGRNYIGLCPFHREKTPSFIVSRDKQICKCFGCSKGGGVINFIKEIENLDFHETLEFLAARANIDLEKYIIKTSHSKDNSNYSSGIDKNKLKEKIYEINTATAKYYHNNLIEKLNEEGSNIIKNYMKKRNLDKNTITRFGLGYATGKVPLNDHLMSIGFSKEEILASGIIVQSENSRLYDRFFKRLIFPIFDIRDRVIAFGGRVLDDTMPKYLNSAENIIYHKGKHLYAFNFAKKEKLENIIIVEGYMDVVSLQKAGFKNVVASLGTALTIDQARLIKKYTDNVIIAYDQDGAGQEATLRGMDILVDRGLNVKVLKLDRDDIKDPDEYVNKMGKERLKHCLDNSITLVEFKVSQFEKDLDFKDTDSKIKFLNNVANILSKIENNITRDVYTDKISEKYLIAKEPILREINKKLAVKYETTNIGVQDLNAKAVLNMDVTKKKEQHIIALLILKDPKIIDIVKSSISENDFKTEKLRKLYIKLLELIEMYDITKVDILSKITEDELVKELVDVMYINLDDVDKIKLLNDVLKNIRKEKYVTRRQEILSRINEEISKEEKQILEIELTQILLELNKLK